MYKEEIKNIPGLEPEKSITIWKMNYGFRSDLQGEISEMTVEAQGKNMNGRASINAKKMKLLNLVYGIYESSFLGIEAPLDLGMGLNEREFENRMRKIRSLDGEAGNFVYNKVVALNKEPAESEKKN